MSMPNCPNCGIITEPGQKFCRVCGGLLTGQLSATTEEGVQPLPHLPFPESSEEASTRHLPPDQTTGAQSPKNEEPATLHLPLNEPTPPEMQRPTSPVTHSPTMPQLPTVSEPPMPPAPYYPPPAPTPYQMPYSEPYQAPYQTPYPAPYQTPPSYQPPPGVQSNIALGDWLSKGWRLYKENGGLMSVATFIAGLMSIISIGILAGPMLMGLYRMAFKTMRGERPELNDLFNWEGRFLQAFLAALIAMGIYGGLSSAGNNNPLVVVLNFLLSPFLAMLVGLTIPLIQDRKMDIAPAINEAVRRIFSRDALMWWIVGFVTTTIASLGFIACGIGGFITIPWMICSLAVAYVCLYGLDDPNRTLP